MFRLCSLIAVLLAASAAAEESLAQRGAVHWAFQPVRRPAIPAVADRQWAVNPIDHFILARLERAGIRASDTAERRTLLRRVTLGLTGLPPTLEETRDFLEDTSPLAYVRLVDRLLASPAYGERWGRHWLDVVRYADTNGYERDGDKPFAWRYRDWVIDALNRDLPYDRFAQHQLAGDEVPDRDAASHIATTFLRLGVWDDEPANATVDRFDQLDDVLGVTASTFLAQTIRCARCHDHFLEPISQKDYYRLLAVFTPLRRPQLDRTDLPVPVGTPEELARYQQQRQAVKAQLAGLPGDDRPVAQIPLAVREKRTRLREQLQAMPSPPLAYVWQEDGPTAPPTRLFRRGNPALVGAEVGPGTPAILGAAPSDAPVPTANTSGRRLWLARWMTRPDNPLFARVIVNRLWHWHFGRGLAANTGDLGLQGDPPSHPELLDWLADELIRSDWSLKRLHRLIVLSATYQTASVYDGPAATARVPLFGRWKSRRLEAEVVRDSLLAVSGLLNRQMRGPGVYPQLPAAVLATQSRPGLGWGKSSPEQADRRSVYIHAKRTLAVPELALLDAPDSNAPCDSRPLSTTAPQALTLFNGEFANRQAEALAARLEREVGNDSARQIGLAFELTLARPPRPEELAEVLAFLDRQTRLLASEGVSATASRRALAAFCLVLLNSNEFLYPG